MWGVRVCFSLSPWPSVAPCCSPNTPSSWLTAQYTCLWSKMVQAIFEMPKRGRRSRTGLLAVLGMLLVGASTDRDPAQQRGRDGVIAERCWRWGVTGRMGLTLQKISNKGAYLFPHSPRVSPQRVIISGRKGLFRKLKETKA